MDNSPISKYDIQRLMSDQLTLVEIFEDMAKEKDSENITTFLELLKSRVDAALGRIKANG